MVRQGLGPIRAALVVVLALAAPGRVGAQAPKDPPIDRKPYAIRALVDFEPGARVDRARRALILGDWLALARRLVGEPWSLSLVEGARPLAGPAIEDWKPDDLKGLAGRADKVWAIRVEASGGGFGLEGREFDAATGTLGEVQRREVAHPVDLPRELVRLALAMFAPTAEVGESKGGGVSFLVKGASVPAAGPLGEVAPVGTIFRALRLVYKPDDSVAEVIPIPFSYFRVERVDGPVATCEIIKGVGDPLTRRFARKNKLVALGIKPASAPTRLRFVLKGDRQPASGYKLTARSVEPGSKPSEVGMTDRDGRVVLPARFAEHLVLLRVLAGDDEPMADVPVMPGEGRDERTIVFEARPLTLDLEANLGALNDAILDVVVVRHRLEARMKARLDGEDWAGLDDAIREFRKLTPRDQSQARLEVLKAGAEQQEAERKTLVVTKSARARLDETQALIDRFLDDDAVRAYEDAARRAKDEAARPKPKAAAPKVARPPPKPTAP